MKYTKRKPPKRVTPKWWWFLRNELNGPSPAQVHTDQHGMQWAYMDGKYIAIWELKGGEWSDKPIPEPKSV